MVEENFEFQMSEMLQMEGLEQVYPINLWMFVADFLGSFQHFSWTSRERTVTHS